MVDLLNIKKLYKERGLDNYKLRNIDDLYSIHNIKLNQIKGYNKLSSKHKILFNNFLIRYFNNHDLNSRNIVPLQIYLSFTEQYYYNNDGILEPYKSITYKINSDHSKEVLNDVSHTDNCEVEYFLKSVDSSLKFKCIVNYGYVTINV